MLIRMLTSAFRRPRPGQARADPASPGGPRHAAAIAAEHALLERVHAACQRGECEVAAKLIARELAAPSTRAEAQRLVRDAVLPVMQACARVGDAATACTFESLMYAALIRAFEEPAHYEACFDVLDEPLHALGHATAHALPAATDSVASPPSLRLLFFVHNLGNDQLAHVQLLADLLDAQFEADPASRSQVGIVGVAGKQLGRRTQELVSRWGLQVWALPPSMPQEQVYREAAALMRREAYDRLVFTSVPTGLAFMSGLIGDQLVWLSMKFELSCFRHLVHRCAFTAGQREERVVQGHRWSLAPPLFRDDVTLRASEQPPPALVQARRFGTIFYTVNRTEKIRNPDFLDAVARILHGAPDSCFVWTGRAEDPDIVAWFARQGLGERHFFAGWVAPDDLLLAGHVFLDTPVLSGAVAARAVAAGCAVMTWTDSRSWVNFFMSAERPGGADTVSAPVPAGLSLECARREQYVAQAVRLGADASLRAAYASALAAFAARHFFDRASSARAHFANLRGEPFAT